MPRLPLIVVFVLPLAFGAFGCTGDETEDGASCPGEVTCGGDPTGDWAFEAACSSADGEEPWICREERSTRRVSVAGFLRLTADGSYEGEMVRTIVSTLEVPRSCIPQQTEATCEQIDEFIARDGSCVLDATACRCSENSTYTLPLVGSWSTTSPARLVLGEDEFDYCVGEDRLDLRYGSEFEGSSYYVLTRR